MNLKINEVFGPTIQGEGAHAGHLVGFLRLANCNLACSWCDTPYSWDWSRFDKSAEVAEYGLTDLQDVIRLWEVSRVILTGGEPLLQQEGLVALAQLCKGIKFDVETNGTIAPSFDLVSAIDMFCVSPKLTHSGDAFKKRIKAKPLEAFADLARQGKAFFKFVCKEPADLQEVKALMDLLDVPNSAVWIMPEGATKFDHLEHLEILIDPVISYGYNLTSRLHILAWGSKRGV